MSDRIQNAVSSGDNLIPQTRLNLVFGGQSGYIPKIGRKGLDGSNFGEWISNQGYVKKNVIPIVLSYPKFIDHLQEPVEWRAVFKSLIETHALSIDGLTSGLTVETDEHAVGGGGEFQQEITDVKRERSNITTVFKEKAGKPIQMFFDFYIRYGIMDPDTKVPLITNYFEQPGLESVGGMYSPADYTATILFIEPDITHKTVVDAWLSTNLFPHSNGDRTGKRNVSEAGEGLEISIEWGGITTNNSAVLQMAQEILESMNITNIPDIQVELPNTKVNSSLAAIDAGFDASR